MLVIGETGFVDGTMRATSLLVLGGVRGALIAAERVEIGPRGRMQGSIESRQLIVQEGAKLDADCRISPTRTNVHVLHATGRGAVAGGRAGDAGAQRPVGIASAAGRTNDSCAGRITLVAGWPFPRNTGGFAGQIAQIVELGAPHLPLRDRLDASIRGEWSGNVRSTPMPYETLRTEKVARLPRGSCE